MFINHDDPLCNYPFFDLQYPVGPIGRFSNFDSYQTEDQILFAWEKELLPGFTGFAQLQAIVYIFLDGVLYDTCRVNQWTYNFPQNKSKVSLDFFILPSWDYTSYPYIPFFSCSKSVSLSWSLDGACKYEEVFSSLENQPFDFSKPIKTFNKPVPSTTTISGTNEIIVDGIWNGKETYCLIEVEITTGGQVDGTAIFKYSYTSEGYTWIYEDNECKSTRENLLNGIKITFDADTVYATGDKWNIKVSLPENYNTPDLEDGDYWFMIRSSNCGSYFGYSGYGYASISTPPDSPVFDEMTYFDDAYGYGYGYAVMTWQAPNNPDLDYAYIYRNYPKENWELDGMIHPIPFQKISPISANDYFSCYVFDLFPGTNKVLAHLVDEDGFEERNYDVVEIEVDENKDRIIIPNKPISLKADCISGSIFITVIADSSSTSIKIYGDNKTNTVDYNTVLSTISNPQSSSNKNILTTTISLTDGIYVLAARAFYNSQGETNIDVKYRFSALTSPPPVPSGLIASTGGN